MHPIEILGRNVGILSSRKKDIPPSLVTAFYIHNSGNAQVPSSCLTSLIRYSRFFGSLEPSVATYTFMAHITGILSHELTLYFTRMTKV